MTWVAVVALLLYAFVTGCEDMQGDNIAKESPSLEKPPAQKESETSTKQAYEKGLEIGKQMTYKQGSEATQELADAIIRGKVHAGLKVAEVDRSGFEVIVKNGVIELKGKAASEIQKAKAEGVAVGVIGDEKKVKNNLTIEGDS